MESEIPPQTERNGEIELEGIIAYAGTTGAGKTYLARKHFDELVSEGCNGLVVDSQGVENFDDIPHVLKVAEIFPALWKPRKESDPGNVVAWTPSAEGRLEDTELVDSVAQVIRQVKGKAGPLVVLVDEFSFWKSCKEVKMLCRCWRHADATLLLTTQHLSADLGQVVFGCNPQLVIFKSTAPRTLDFLEKWHGLDNLTVKEIPEHEYILRRF